MSDASTSGAPSEIWWLARVRTPAGVIETLRARTGGESPGPATRWEPIADVVARARVGLAPVDLERCVRDAEACGPARVLVDDQLLAPLMPEKLFAIGRNYRAHAAELGNAVPDTPLSFLKPPSCLLPSGAALELPRGFERIDMESELVVVIGRRGRAIAAAEAWDHVGGYLLGNDVSCRDLQRRDKQWTRAKGFDGFGPVSAYLRLTPPGFELPVASIEIAGYLDDLEVQRSSLAAMVFSIPALIEHLSAHMTLELGDLVFTGTPAGVSALAPGQVVRVELDGFTVASLVTPVC